MARGIASGYRWPDPRSRRWQEFCSNEECRKASKAARQARWVAKNRDYWRGKEHVERVRAWRARNPGYSKRGAGAETAGVRAEKRRGQAQKEHGAVGKRERANGKGALQDDWKGALALKKCVPTKEKDVALQDDWVPDDPLLVGLIAMVTKGALQDDMALVCRDLIAKGREILAAHTKDGSVQSKAQF